MAKTIKLFNEMKPESPEYTDANHIYSMQGVAPLYYLSDTTTVEKQVAPLTASYQSRAISSYTGTVNQIIPSGTTVVFTPNYVNFDAFTVYDDGSTYMRVGGVSTSGITALGTPGNTATPDRSARILVGNNGKLIFTTQQSSTIYTLPISDGSVAQGTSWTGSAPGDYFPFGVVAMTAFQNYVALSSRADIAKKTCSVIRMYPYSTVFSAGAAFSLDLGQGWQIQKLENYANKYIVAGAYYSTNLKPKGGFDGTLPDSNISYLFFWNGSGTTSARYQFSVRVPGVFVDMIYSTDGILYVLVLERSGRYALYHYSGGDQLKRDFALQVDIPNLYVGNGLFAYPAGVGINLQNKGTYIYTKLDGREYRYIHTQAGDSAPQAVCISTNGTFYATTVSNFLYYPETYLGTGGYFNDINAVTQWIPLSTKLTSLSMWYESKPQAVGDYIRVTVTAWSEDQADGTLTQVLSDITSTNFDTAIKTTLDIKGLTGNMLKLQIQTRSTGSWRPIIRKVELNEHNINN